MNNDGVAELAMHSVATRDDEGSSPSAVSKFFDRLELERRAKEIKEWDVHTMTVVWNGRGEIIVYLVPNGTNPTDASIVQIEPKLSQEANIPQYYNGTFELSVTLDALNNLPP